MWHTTAENPVYTFAEFNNGSDALWTRANTCLVTSGQRLFASGVELIPNAKPLNNVRWTLWECVAGKWTLRQRDTTGRTREPSPLCVTSDGRLWLSANPTTQPNQTAGRAQPQVISWDAGDTQSKPGVEIPTWDGEPPFCEHSYRSFVADGANNELLLMQNIELAHAEWSFRDRHEHWSACGKLVWPCGAEYEVPQPIRICYPTVQLKNRAVHFCGVSDIEEPNAEWKQYKYELTGQKWDYDFRRLFYCWTPDIRQQPFGRWIEVASRETTCGWITPCDLHVADGGRVHLLWIERAIDVRLREKFFPGERQSFALHHAIIDDGEVVSRRELVRYDERDGWDQVGEIRWAKFHVGLHGLRVVYHDAPYRPGFRTYFNRIAACDGTTDTLAVTSPMEQWYTTTPRAGCEPSDQLHMLGTVRGKQREIQHIHITPAP